MFVVAETPSHSLQVIPSLPASLWSSNRKFRKSHFKAVVLPFCNDSLQALQVMWTWFWYLFEFLYSIPGTTAQTWFPKWELDFPESSSPLKTRSILCEQVVPFVCHKTKKKFWWKTNFISFLSYRQHAELPLGLWIYLHPFTINPNGTYVEVFFSLSRYTQSCKTSNV